MLDVFQIIAICLLGAGLLVSVGFTIAFIVESTRKEKKVKPIKATPVKEVKEEVTEIDLDEMLARLEDASNKKKVVEVKEEIKEETKEEEKEDIDVDDMLAKLEEVSNKKKDKETKEEVNQELKIVKKEVAKEDKEETPTTIIINNISAEKSGPEFDYRIRLEKIKESQTKIDRDLDKTTRAILKYERTIRRKERNQKMLDRRALELTNLNLLMYSVTDIKNVDAEKKARQEELTAHIAELKASIQDAEMYIEANAEKHDNNLKLREYLSREKVRYAEEVKELESLIKAGKFFDDKAGNGSKK